MTIYSRIYASLFKARTARMRLAQTTNLAKGQWMHSLAALRFLEDPCVTLLVTRTSQTCLLNEHVVG